MRFEERDYAKQPLTAPELELLFKGRDPRDYLNPRSPVYKAMKLGDKELTPADAIQLMTREPNLLKRPIVVAGAELIAGFDRDRIRAALK